MEIIIPRPNGATDLRLFPVERVMPLIKRYTQLSPDIADVIEAVGECQEEIGHKYGCEYLALLPVERDGMAYLPLHARKVIGVYPAPWASTLEYAATWHPDSYHMASESSLSGGFAGSQNAWPNRQWVADQIGGMSCFRSSQLESIARSPCLEPMTFHRTGEGVLIPQLRERLSGMIKHALVIYDAELTDERGYPLVNDRDARACAYYWNWQRLMAADFGGGKVDPNTLARAAEMATVFIEQARVGDGLTDNDWRLIQRTSASWDRTTFRQGLAGPGRTPTAAGTGHWSAADSY